MYPRAITLGLLIKDDYLLLEELEGKHSTDTGFYYRPIGGTIEFGETSDQTLIREYYEELGVEVSINRYIGCLENIFVIDEEIGHEMIQLYRVDFQDQSLYHKEWFTVSEGTKVGRAVWVAKRQFLSGQKVLYPAGLIDLLRKGL